MTDRPILFSAPMVRALLDGRKSQTRRVLKPQPGGGYEAWQDEDTQEWFTSGHGEAGDWGPLAVRFRKGDRLWVREAWQGFNDSRGAVIAYRATCNGDTFDFAAADGSVQKVTIKKWRPGIHMPRWASRLTLTVTDERVQRLQECGREDALAEGIQVGAPLPEVPDSAGDIYHDGVTDPLDGWTRNPVAAYANLWDHINGAGAWAANPWIVALTFTVERRNIDAC